MELISRKFNIRVRAIRHLKASGIPPKDIVTVYTFTIRSVIEYASPVVYHPMLSAAQAENLEKMQRICLEIIFGHKLSYSKALEEAKLQTLKDRREEITLRFAKKNCSSNHKFDRWFPLQASRLYLQSPPPKQVS